MENFEKAFKLPFHLDKYGESYVLDATKNQMVLMFDDEVTDTELKKAIVHCINTGNFSEILKDKEFTNLNQDDEIFMDGKYLMCIRGWGYLTGIGGLNLTQQDAIDIQDDLVHFIINRLTNDPN